MTDESKTIEFTIESSNERLDRAVVRHVESLSRAQIQTLIRDGLVTVDGERAKASLKLKGGERIAVTLPPQAETTLEAEDIAFNIVYEDDDLAVIDKPAGLVVHPGMNNETGTLVHGLLARWPQIAEMPVDEKRVGIVHRLDKGTSGLIVVAKHDVARRHLMEQFQARTVEKVYLALVERVPKTRTGRIEAPIMRDPNNRKRMAVRREGKPAITEFRVLEDDFSGGQALVEATLLTGRTHQIRVHLAFIGCPIVGDSIYGFRKQRVKLKRQFLHATRLCFDQPTSGERLCFESALPVALQNLLDKLRN
ncbi:MAG: RluA family pseudouridine synthase [Chloroflexi bacterium]|nr:MAG: RNA pseudouridine synthase [Phototrophicales bacterium]RMF81016.1 MAG: RluA family pseudouridine synthase [Chloroflexota bacterium]